MSNNCSVYRRNRDNVFHFQFQLLVVIVEFKKFGLQYISPNVGLLKFVWLNSLEKKITYNHVHLYTIFVT